MSRDHDDWAIVEWLISDGARGEQIADWIVLGLAGLVVGLMFSGVL